MKTVLRHWGYKGILLGFLSWARGDYSDPKKWITLRHKKKRVHFNSCPSFKLDQYMFGYAYLNTYCESHAFHGGDQLTCTSIATMPHQNTPIIQGERYNSLQLKGTGLNQMNIDLMCLWNWPVLNRTLMLYQHRSVAYPSLWGIWRGEGAWIEDVKEP